MVAKIAVAFVLGLIAGVTCDRWVFQAPLPCVSAASDSDLRSIRSGLDAVLAKCNELTDEIRSGTKNGVPTQTGESALPLRTTDTSHVGDDLVLATQTALENVKAVDNVLRSLLQQLPSRNTALVEMLIAAPPPNHDELARFNQEYGSLSDKQPAAEELSKATPTEILHRFGRPNSWTPDSWTWTWRSNLYRNGQSGTVTIQFVNNKPIVKDLTSN